MIIRGHDLQEHSVDQFDEINRIYGVNGYQLAIKKSFDVKDKVLTEDNISCIDVNVFKHTKILGAYFNPVHPNLEEVRIGIENFIFNMKLAEKHGIKYVGSETGSRLGSPWDYHPDNHLAKTIALSTEAFSEIASRTEGINVGIAIEPAYHHVIKDVDTLLEMDIRIGDERMVYILDLYNLLNSRPYQDYKEVLAEFLDKAGSKTKIVHLKDFIIEDNMVKQVKIGSGIVDFEYVINQIISQTSDPLFVLEGTPESDLLDVTNIVSKLIAN